MVSGPTARNRPFSLPASLDELDGPTVVGRVRLPVHLEWSTGRVYDLAEQFDKLVLPDEVRSAWARLLGRRAA